MAENTDLVRLAYTFYPKGKYDGDESYFNTDEAKKLLAARKTRTLYLDIINKIGAEYSSVDDSFVFEDLSGILSKSDRCVKARFAVNGQALESSIMLYISFCAPYFVLYQIAQSHIFSITDQSSHLVDNKAAREMSEIKKWIEEKLWHYLPSYQKMTKASQLIELENVIFDGVGKLEYFSSNPLLKKMTLFNAFFSDQYF